MKSCTLLFFCQMLFLLVSIEVWAHERPVISTGTCGQKNIEIFYEVKKDYLIGCEGITRAQRFFTAFHYDVDAPIHLYFRDQVFCDFEGEIDKQLIWAYFDRVTMSAHISSITSSFVSENQKEYLRVKLGSKNFIAEMGDIDVLEEFQRSIVAHEVAHILAEHNFILRSANTKKKLTSMGHGVHEYIAAVVQLSTMEKSLREYVLRGYNPQITIDAEEQINILLYACDPEKFAIMAYRYFKRQNRSLQMNLFDKILENRLNPDSWLE